MALEWKHTTLFVIQDCSTSTVHKVRAQAKLLALAEGSGLFRQASNGSLLRFGSLVLPSSMDLRHYIEEVAQIDPQVRPPPAAVIER